MKLEKTIQRVFENQDIPRLLPRFEPFPLLSSAAGFRGWMVFF